MRTSLGTVVPEAPLEHTETGLQPASDGWFVLNAHDACWYDGELGAYTPFAREDARFEQVRFNIVILRPGEPNGMYHGEDVQEDFLVLAGECLLLVEGEERRLRAWDFVHCPPWTEHIFVGAGGEPCLIAMVSARRKGDGIRYPVNELARTHGASVEKETTYPSEAYARFPEDRPVPCPSEFPSSG
jgi:uncharacterized cupin superfamily protein